MVRRQKAPPTRLTKNSPNVLRQGVRMQPNGQTPIERSRPSRCRRPSRRRGCRGPPAGRGWSGWSGRGCPCRPGRRGSRSTTLYTSALPSRRSSKRCASASISTGTGTDALLACTPRMALLPYPIHSRQTRGQRGAEPFRVPNPEDTDPVRNHCTPRRSGGEQCSAPRMERSHQPRTTTHGAAV